MFRRYRSDKSKSHVNTTTHQIPTPGWMKRIIKDNSQQVWYMKIFRADGQIREGEINENDNQINGWMWQLKDDGTFDKFKVETHKIDRTIQNEDMKRDEDKEDKEDKEDEEDDEDDEDDDEKDEDEEEEEEEVFTFVCNEKSYC